MWTAAPQSHDIRTTLTYDLLYGLPTFTQYSVMQALLNIADSNTINTVLLWQHGILLRDRGVDVLIEFKRMTFLYQ